MKKIFIFFLLITFLFWLIRFWRFEELMTFYSDQALFLDETWQMVGTREIRLIGPMVISKVVEGRGFFTGPLFYYLLTPLAILTRWDVISMTKIFMGIWWLTGVSLFFWVGKNHGWFAGLSAYAVYTVFPYLFVYNRLLWNPSFLPLLGVFFFWLIFLIKEKSKLIRWFGLGVIVGLGIDFHYGAAIWGLIALVIWFYGAVLKSWFKRSVIFLFFAGLLVGNFPWFLFELRHNFYNLSTMFFVFTHSAGQMVGQKFDWRPFFFPLTPLVFWTWGVFIAWVWRGKRTLAFALSLFTFLLLMLMIPWRQTQGVGMPNNWTVRQQKRVADLICQDTRGIPFEIASTINGDTRATDLRWWIARVDCQPMGVEDYEVATVLYLVAPATRPPENETVWEVKSLRPFSTAWKVDLGEEMFLYKLVRQPSCPCGKK